MPTPPNQQQDIPASTGEPAESPAADEAENAEPPENASEVAKRISLLGKLIIPPAPR
jgi:hypothetical protein